MKLGSFQPVLLLLLGPKPFTSVQLQCFLWHTFPQCASLEISKAEMSNSIEDEEKSTILQNALCVSVRICVEVDFKA